MYIYIRVLAIWLVVSFSVNASTYSGIKVGGCEWSLGKFFTPQNAASNEWVRSERGVFSMVEIGGKPFSAEELTGQGAFHIYTEEFKLGLLYLFFFSSVERSAADDEVTSMPIFVYSGSNEHIKFYNVSKARLDSVLNSCKEK